jgi:hypothetical protein
VSADRERLLVSALGGALFCAGGVRTSLGEAAARDCAGGASGVADRVAARVDCSTGGASFAGGRGGASATPGCFSATAGLGVEVGASEVEVSVG